MLDESSDNPDPRAMQEIANPAGLSPETAIPAAPGVQDCAGRGGARFRPAALPDRIPVACMT
jgi:hypothetical protein